MDPKTELADLLEEADTLAKKSDLTDEDIARVDVIAKRIPELEETLRKRAEADATLKRLATESVHKSDTIDGNHETAAREGLTLGERFVKSDAMVEFRKAHPSGIGRDTPIQIKAEHIGPRRVMKADPAPLNTGGANLQPVRLPGIDDLTYRQPTTIMDLITQGTASSPLLQYRQLIAIQAAASIVAEAKTTTGTTPATGLKPLSTLTTATKNAAAFTYADGIEITNQELQDDGALVALIDGILRQNLALEMERVLLDGAGTDDEPAGIMHTTGVLQQDFATDVVTTIRKAKTLLRVTSQTEAQAIVLNPEDDEAFDLLKDTTGRYYGNGPFGVGPQNIWAIPRVTSTRIPKGTAVMGDFSQVQLLNLEPTTVLAFNQHKDYAQRNLSYLRAECRCLQLIRQPAKLAIVDLVAGA